MHPILLITCNIKVDRFTVGSEFYCIIDQIIYNLINKVAVGIYFYIFTKLFSVYSMVKKTVLPGNYIVLTVVLVLLIALAFIYKKNYAKSCRIQQREHDIKTKMSTVLPNGAHFVILRFSASVFCGLLLRFYKFLPRQDALLLRKRCLSLCRNRKIPYRLFR